MTNEWAMESLRNEFAEKYGEQNLAHVSAEVVQLMGAIDGPELLVPRTADELRDFFSFAWTLVQFERELEAK